MAAEESYPELLFICIFWLLHAIFSLTEYLMAFCYLLSSRWRAVFSQEKCIDLELVKNISKLPKHVAFLVLENDVVYDDVAKLVIWSLLVGINVISLYDVHGKLKKNQGKLLGAINKEYIKYIQTADPFKLIWQPHDDSEGISDKNQTVIVNRNGVMYPDKNGNGGVSAIVNGSGRLGRKRNDCDEEYKTVTISLLSQTDGKGDIVNVTKHMGKDIRENKLAQDDINVEMVGKYLSSNQGQPDPCVLVRLGRLASNVDFLPWQLRLTEMFSIPSHQGVTPDKLVQVLRKYGKCEQRLGK